MTSKEGWQPGNTGIRRVAVAIGLLLVSMPAFADSWNLPTVEEHLSADRQTRVIVTPRELEGQLSYFEDKTKGKEAAGQRAGSSRTHATAQVQRKGRKGAWSTVWEKPLVNDVAPVSVLVANDARYLVTLDNWHSMGWGPNAIVVYGADGELTRRFALTDILPKGYVDALPRSVSSINWRGRAALVDGDQTLALEVVAPGSADDDDPSAFIDVRIRLSDGHVTLPVGDGWTGALAGAAKVNAARRAREEEFRFNKAKQISMPADVDEETWTSFLLEIVVRRFWGEQMFPEVLFLPSIIAANHAERRTAISNAIASFGNSTDRYRTHYVFGSPDSKELADLMQEELAKFPAGSAAGIQIIFVGTPAENEQVRVSTERTGAGYHFVDMTKPVAGINLPPLDKGDQD